MKTEKQEGFCTTSDDGKLLDLTQQFDSFIDSTVHIKPRNREEDGVSPNEEDTNNKFTHPLSTAKRRKLNMVTEKIRAQK